MDARLGVVVMMEYGGEGVQWVRKKLDDDPEYEMVELRDAVDNSYVGEIRWREDLNESTTILLTYFYFEEPWRLRGYGRWNGGAMLDELDAAGYTYIKAVGMTNTKPFEQRFQQIEMEFAISDQNHPFRVWVRSTPYPRRPEST